VDSLPGASFFLVRARISWDRHTQTLGWGRSSQADVAQCKAIGEASERYAFGCLPDNAMFAAAHELPSFIDPGRLTGMTPEQYSSEGFPCAPFDRGDRRWWLPARTAGADRCTWILADCVCSPGAFDDVYRERLVTRANSSGCASAEDIDTAILRAAFELLERDAFMRHWFAQCPGTAIDAASLPSPYRHRLEALRRGGCSAGVQSLTLGLHPTLLAWAQHEDLHFTCVGAASGANADDVLDAALSELEVPALARMMGVPVTDIEPGEVRTPMDHVALYATAAHFRRADALWTFHEQEAVSFDQIRAAFPVSASALYDRLARAGHELFWTDLTPELCRRIEGVAAARTVRVAAPGLIPLIFGPLLSPQAFDVWRTSGGRFFHPFG
jgi:ribosomal protein S12 methylthiotransferase accessory factor